MKNKPEKRGRGRPSGTAKFTYRAQVPMEPEKWDRLAEIARQEGKSGAAEIIRSLVDRFLKRHS